MEVTKLIRNELGVEPIINAAGTKTKAGGTWLDPAIAAAMSELTGHFYVVKELNIAVGRYIASVTGAEAGCVTSGAGSGMVVAAAACMAGRDPALIRQLPDARGMKDQIVIHRVHQGQYSHMYAQTGAKLIEIGHLQRTHTEELRHAINERTAAIAYLCGPGVPDTAIDLNETCKIAHEFNVPVIVDAAAMLPPRANFRKFIDQGADLVTISGGKVIGGPQASGLLFGKKELIAAALANSSPEHSSGRAHKISKEQIFGLYLALRKYVEGSDEADEIRWQARSEALRDALSLPYDVGTTILRDEWDFNVPVTAVKFGQSWPRSAADQAFELLLAEAPRIYAIADPANRRLILNPLSLKDSEVAIVAAAVSSVLGELAQALMPMASWQS